MSRVEERLSLVPEKLDEEKDEVVKVQAETLQKWVERLSFPKLSLQERLEIAWNLKQALFVNYVCELSPPIVYAV
jgi:hypothetical protein